MDFKILFLIVIVILHAEADDEKSVSVDVYPDFVWDDLRFLDMSPVSSIVELMFINEIEGMNNIHTHTYIYNGEEEQRERERERERE
jgi:hypothetical protein